MPEVTEHAQGFHRHGEPDPEKWDEQEAVTGRPNDTPLRGEDDPAVPNSTFAERAKSAKDSDTKRVDDETDTAQNKAVTSGRAKRATKKRA